MSFTMSSLLRSRNQMNTKLYGHVCSLLLVVFWWGQLLRRASLNIMLFEIKKRGRRRETAGSHEWRNRFRIIRVARRLLGGLSARFPEMNFRTAMLARLLWQRAHLRRAAAAAYSGADGCLIDSYLMSPHAVRSGTCMAIRRSSDAINLYRAGLLACATPAVKAAPPLALVWLSVLRRPPTKRRGLQHEQLTWLWAWFLSKSYTVYDTTRYLRAASLL